MKPPCIRNLPAFADGCPRRPYDEQTGEGCPGWIEKVAPTTGEPLKKDNHRMCLDHWMMKLSWDLQGKVEGQLAAIELLRNGLLYYDEKEKTVSPKPDYAMRELVKMIKAQHLMLEEKEGPLTITQRAGEGDS